MSCLELFTNIAKDLEKAAKIDRTAHVKLVLCRRIQPVLWRTTRRCGG